MTVDSSFTSYSYYPAPDIQKTYSGDPALVSPHIMPIAMSPTRPSIRPQILFLGDDVKYNPSIYERLTSQFDIIQPPPAHLERSAFLQHLRAGTWGDFQAIMRPSWHTGGEMGKWDKELIELLPQGLKVYASAGAGYDWVDTARLAEHGTCRHSFRSVRHTMIGSPYLAESRIIDMLIQIHRHHLLQWRRCINRSRRRHGPPSHHLRLPPHDLVYLGRTIARSHAIRNRPP